MSHFAEARGLLDNQFAEAHQQGFERGQIDGLAAPHAPKRFKNFRLLHQALGESAIQRRKSESMITVNLD